MPPGIAAKSIPSESTREQSATAVTGTLPALGSDANPDSQVSPKSFDFSSPVWVAAKQIPSGVAARPTIAFSVDSSSIVSKIAILFWADRYLGFPGVDDDVDRQDQSSAGDRRLDDAFERLSRID